MVVQHNLTAMNANRYLGINNNKLSKSLEKLSSGYAINRAGDNAAGLAVSEKMRSQIAGMTQAVKNAQDGISMVQTFEGALTETDSILQRMKTLADQMANGSYDDPVDRTAAQQEFLQLNDELDQIADTDFNGVVVLNGGVMADGTKANGVSIEYTVDNDKGVKSYDKTAVGAGLIDYANKEQSVIDKATGLAGIEVAKAQKAYDDAKAATLNSNFDLSAGGSAQEWNTVDDKLYTKTEADALWVALGYTKADGTTADTSKVNSVDITFTLDTDGTTWKATSGVDNTGTSVDSAKLTGAIANATTKGTIGTQSGLGGVEFTVGGKAVNAIFDATTAKAGDTITLTFTNADPAKKAPTNMGYKDNSVTVANGTIGTQPDITINASTDAAMTDEIVEKFNAVDGAKIDWEIAAGQTDTTGTGGKISITDKTGKVDLVTAGNTLKFDLDGKEVSVFAKANAGAIEFYDKSGGTKLFTIAKPEVTQTDATAVTTVSGNIAVEKPEYKSPAVEPDVSAGKNPNLGTSNAAMDALKAAEKTLGEKKAAQAKLQDFESAKAYLTENGVSISDTFDNSEAKMTYKDTIILQAGARTKDAVEFTFKYKSDAIGSLRADLDCTANGLGTDKLNLSTQEAANYAVDKIDQAINKVSLVRGTFGAIQNRLEHKIDNLNVSVENLTSAESQIRDTNMPTEMMNFTKQQILAQASQSMLAQANQLPQGVLSLLQ